MPEKSHLNVVVVGHVDHGKSTTMGHMLHLKGAVDDRTINDFAQKSEEAGRGDTFKFAYVMDKLKEERERGVTIDLSYWKFDTNKFLVTIIDAPGHRDFIKNMITGASQADCALLVSSARKGEFEVGVEAGGQTREHAFLLRTLGVNQVIVAVNKFDDQSVNYSEERFNECKKQLEYLLKTVGFDPSKIPVIPISGWYGDNLLKKSEKTPWYDGPTLFEAFDNLTIPSKPIDKPLRLPVQDVYTITGIGTVPVGRVETGVLKDGDRLIFIPSGATGEVKSLEMHHEKIPKAEPGDNIGFNIRGLAKKDISRGDVGAHPNNPPPLVKEFIGQIIVVFHPTSLAVGYTPVLHAHTCQIACKFTELLKKINPRTGETVEEKPAFLKTGDGALVKLAPLGPIAIETYADTPQIGRFAIRDMGTTIAAGVVKEITQTEKLKKD